MKQKGATWLCTWWAGYFWNEYTATSRVEPIFAHVNMHGFGWKFLAPSSSCARNSAMKIAERSSLRILPNPNTIISHTWPRHSTWSSTGPAGHVQSPSVSKMEASKFPRSSVGECAVLLIAGLCISTLSQTPCPSEETLNRDPPYLVLYARGSKRHHPGGKGVTCVWTLILG